MFFSAHDTIRCVKSVCFRIDDAKFAHLVKMVSAKSPHCNITIFYLVINKQFVGRETLKILFFIRFPFNSFSISGGFGISAIPFIFINKHSILRKFMVI